MLNYVNIKYLFVKPWTHYLFISAAVLTFAHIQDYKVIINILLIMHPSFCSTFSGGITFILGLTIFCIKFPFILKISGFKRHFQFIHIVPTLSVAE